MTDDWSYTDHKNTLQRTFFYMFLSLISYWYLKICVMVMLGMFMMYKHDDNTLYEN